MTRPCPADITAIVCKTRDYSLFFLVIKLSISCLPIDVSEKNLIASIAVEPLENVKSAFNQIAVFPVFLSILCKLRESDMINGSMAL